MVLDVGARLGPYEILSALGAGGMGEVYRARDTRLDRIVAIKVLPASLAGDQDLRERFDREARAISALEHPHICALYDIGTEGGMAFLVMQYLEGETLADRLKRGALPLEQALTTGIQICEALDRAHRAGIVHRDLKPANVMLTRPGAKLLDFGLAKIAAPAMADAGQSMRPTTPPNLTTPGMMLGTFQYMAPEQIEGADADARTDIFAFGALLFEMVTGRPAFGGNGASVLGAILKEDPPRVSRLQPGAPAALDRLVYTCLKKDPEDRYQSARDLRRDLVWLAAGGGDGDTVPTVAAAPRRNLGPWLVAALALVGLFIAAALVMRNGGLAAPALEPAQFTITPAADTYFGGPPGPGTGIATQVAVSPDGRQIAFVAGGRSGYQIWLRPVASPAATPIAGTEGGAFPFWSPDSQFIGFFAGGKLKKVQLSGAPPTVLCDAPGGRGGTWNRENVILFGIATGGLMRVSSAGGTPMPVITPDPASGEAYRWPHFLSDGRHFVYTATIGACCPPSKPSSVRIGSLDSADAGTKLFEAESSVSYAAGHLLYVRDEALVAQPFDVDALRLNGEAFPVAERISRDGSRYVSASMSANGTLVYGQGTSTTRLQLTWMDRAGQVLGTLGEVSSYTSLTLSPDGRQVAVALGTGSPENIDIWVIDTVRNVRSRLTTDAGTERGPVWSPDGTRVVFSSADGGRTSLRGKLINGAVDEVLLDDISTPERPCEPSQCTIWPNDLSSDGRFLTYTVIGTFPTTSHVWILPLFGERKPFQLGQGTSIEASGRISPDGRWIAYSSNEAGARNIYVQPFPPTGQRYQVSSDGGSTPVWRRDGRELFYIGADATMMAVAMDAGGQPRFGAPAALFQTSAPLTNNARLDQMYAVTNDGSRFLISRRSQESAAALTVVLNWPATIRK